MGEALNARFDLDYIPGSFDFFWSLQNVRLAQRWLGYHSAKVAFYGDNFAPRKGHGFRGLFDPVLIPLIEMLGLGQRSSFDPCGIVLHNAPMNMSSCVAAWEQKGDMPARAAPDAQSASWAEHYRGAVVITLREADHHTERNSRLGDWIQAAKVIGQTERVVFVRETGKHEEEFPLETCALASINLKRRTALYQVAKMNLLVCNGPGTLLLSTNDIPYLIFFTQEAIKQYERGQSSFRCLELPGLAAYTQERHGLWRGWFGFDKHEQVPWHGPKQELVWADDTTENILAAWGKLS